MCASPTLVQTRSSGSAIATSVLISPGWFMPSSITATSGRSRSCSSDSGSPMWLFRFPLFFTTRKRTERNSAIASFVGVFPALPVIATTRAPLQTRTAWPRSWSALVVSSTSTMAAPSAPATKRRSTIAPAAPLLTASATNSWPSWRAPRSATKNPPGSSARVSIPMAWISMSGSPARIRPPTASATHRNVRCSPSPNQQPVAPGRERLPRDRHIVERQQSSADFLVRLVPLAGDEQEIARRRVADRVQNRGATIDDRQHLDAALTRLLLRAEIDLVDDPLRLLHARVVGRDHHDVAEPRRHHA